MPAPPSSFGMFIAVEAEFRAELDRAGRRTSSGSRPSFISASTSCGISSSREARGPGPAASRSSAR